MTEIQQAEKDPPNQGGFTLIEMLIVILVLGILAGIAIFNHGALAERARDVCNSNNARIEVTVADAMAIDDRSYEEHFDIPPGNCNNAASGYNQPKSPRIVTATGGTIALGVDREGSQ